MAVKKISELNSIDTIADTDVMPIVDVSETETKKISSSQLKTYSQGDLPTKLAQKTNYNATTEDGTGKIKCTLTGTLASGDIVNITIPTLANTSATMQLSIDNGVHYYYIKQMSDDAVFNDYANTEISASKCTLYFDGTNFILDKSKFGCKIINNLNTISKNGSYIASKTATGVLNSTYSWFVNHNNSNAGTLYATQRAVAYSTDLIVYERTKINGTWGAWENVNAGWLSLNRCTFTYTSFTSATYTAVISTSIDLTGVLSVGMKIRLIQSSTTKYGIITAISSTSMTLFMGTDYTLANATISNVYYADRKAPYGFPLNPDKWAVSLTDTTGRSQSNPTLGTWYNLGNLSLTIPIGLWAVSYSLMIASARSTAGTCSTQTTLSTTNNNSSDASMTRVSEGGDLTQLGFTSIECNRPQKLLLSSDTTYYFNLLTNASGISSIFEGNDGQSLNIKAICAYL